MMTKTKAKIRATDVLREYGKAIRYDWSSIDGRCVRYDLDYLADEIEEGGEGDARALRLAVGLCPKGHGKWMGEAPECDKCDERNDCR